MSESSHSKDELRETAIAYRAAQPDFDLPSSDFDSRSPTLSPTEYVAWCARMREALNLNQDTSAHRLALKTSKEFVW
jgi:hypothetical protein